VIEEKGEAIMKTRNWHAWINAMPPGPNNLHVVGEVLVGNPGIQGELTIRQPQGINPAILLLDLHLVQRPGMWPQVMTWKQVRFDKVMVPRTPRYTEVQVFAGGTKPIAKMKVEVAQ
jgi:hypothetical protein